MTPIKLSIGVANNEWGCTVVIMQHDEDGCVTVHYSGMHPEGDSVGVFQIEVGENERS